MQLVVREDKSEQFLYKCAEFPAYFGYGRLADYPDYAALGHWHDDIEFSLVLSGGMDYNVNGETVHLNPGEGIFINSRQMHFNFSRDHQNGEYICILLHPMLLCASQYVEDNFVAPVLNHPTFSYQVFHAGYDWGRRVCDKPKWMYARQSQPKFQLAIQAAFLQIWEEVYQQELSEKDQIGGYSACRKCKQNYLHQHISKVCKQNAKRISDGISAAQRNRVIEYNGYDGDRNQL